MKAAIAGPARLLGSTLLQGVGIGLHVGRWIRHEVSYDRRHPHAGLLKHYR